MALVRNFRNIIGKLLAQEDFFSCELQISEKLYFKIWERPGRWCDEEELKKITKDVRSVIDNSDDGKDTPEYGILTGDKADLEQRVVSIIYDESDEAIGFSAQAYIDLKIGLTPISVLHLGLVYISDKARGKNITVLLYSLPSLILMMKNAFRKQWISNVTQVPAVFGLVQDFYSKTWPSLNMKSPSYEHKVLAKRIYDEAKEVFGVGEDSSFDYKRHIIINAYTGGSDNLKKTFEECTPYRLNDEVNTYMKENLDYDRGDDVLQLAQLDIWLFVKVLKNKVIRSNYSAVVFNLFIFFFIALILPYLRWLIPNKNNKDTYEL